MLNCRAVATDLERAKWLVNLRITEGKGVGAAQSALPLGGLRVVLIWRNGGQKGFALAKSSRESAIVGERNICAFGTKAKVVRR